MQEILGWAIAALMGTFLSLAAIIIGNKVVRDYQNRRHARVRARLEPIVVRYAAGEIIHAEAFDGIPKSEFRILEEVLLEWSGNCDDSEEERLTAALEQLGFVDRRIGQLQSRSWWTRATAAEALGSSGSYRATQPLTDALEDESPEVRLRAATALSELGGSAALRPLIRILDEPNRWSTIRVANILEQRGPSIVQEVIEAYPQLGPTGKAAILDILADLDVREAAPWIRDQLADEDPNVRSRAAHALGQLGDFQSGPRLLDMLYHPEWPVRAMAAKALGNIRYPDAINGLCVALRSEDWWVRANSAEALGRIGPEGLAALERMLDDADIFAGQQAVRVLEDAGIVDRQVDHLSTTDLRTRTAARSFVERIIGTGQIDRLRELSADHPDEAVRYILGVLLPATEQAAQGELV